MNAIEIIKPCTEKSSNYSCLKMKTQACHPLNKNNLATLKSYKAPETST